ncbi:MAG: hypothetical protein AMS24_02920 [Chlamydiae bacterium SM23_39]|nr:MAG: hypothetical protein AMS24_02920 [Chlamydiae bacterium SM23_39]
MRKKIFFWFNNEEEDSFINLTPLIDVVFVVLIAFIILAPFVNVEHIDLASSSIKNIKNISDGRIKIYVRKDNSIWMENKKINLVDLPKILKEKKKFFPIESVQLYHDKKAFFGTYQLVKKFVEEAGFKRLDLVVKN